jgi:hypothetical protein
VLRTWTNGQTAKKLVAELSEQQLDWTGALRLVVVTSGPTEFYLRPHSHKQ